MAEPILELRQIKKSFDDTPVLNGVSLSVERGEFLTILGPSGCGKTTTLRVIAGLTQPDEGAVLLAGRDVTALPPEKRSVNTVFQNYALFPHMTVEKNIAYGLSLRKVPRAEQKEIVRRMLSLVALEGYEKRMPSQLSGGQRQRVAIARAVALKPDILLLDEPLGALDLKLRKEMQLELKSMQQQLGITFIYVTHDQEEALTMSDTIVVMNGGRIQQIGDGKKIYDEPKNAFVANFIGDSNILPATMLRDFEVSAAGHLFECVDEGFEENLPVDMVVRPEDIMLVGTDVGMLEGEVKSVLFKGVHYEMKVDTGDFTWKVHSTTMYPTGSRVGLSIVPSNIHIMRKMEAEKNS